MTGCALRAAARISSVLLAPGASRLDALLVDIGAAVATPADVPAPLAGASPTLARPAPTRAQEPAARSEAGGP